MPRFFNTSGPNRRERHHTLPTLRRLTDVHDLIDRESCVVLHAPRRSGKTTATRALAQELTASGDYAGLWASCEAAEPWSDHPAEVGRAIVFDVRRQAQSLPEALQPPPPDDDVPGSQLLGAFVSS